MGTKANYAMVTLTALLLGMLGWGAMPEPTHQCDSRELDAYCFSISPTEKTCYTLPENQRGKRCTEGWKEKFQPVEVIVTGKPIGEQYLCDTFGKCVEK